MEINHVCYEVKSYLDFLGNEYIEKIPKKLYANINDGANKYISENHGRIIDFTFSDSKNKLSKEARALIYQLDYNYFSDEAEKKELRSFLNQNEKNKKKNMNYNIFQNGSISDKEKLENETLDYIYERARILNDLIGE